MITRSILQSLSQPRSFQRGEQYYLRGKVLTVHGDGKLFQGKVAGQAVYRQVVDVEKELGHCSCPYVEAGWCKHLVAVGLAIIAGEFLPPGEIVESEAVNQLGDQYQPEDHRMYARALSAYLAQQNWKTALDLLMGVYEGWYKGELAAKRPIGPELSPEVKSLSLRLVEGLLTGGLTHADWKALQDRWFSRWDHYEQANAQLPSKPSLRYEVRFFEPLFAAFQQDPISAHYLEMRRQAYGL